MRNPDHLAAALESFFWPKIFFDWTTKLLDPAVKPIPILQIISLCIALVTLAYEWPLALLAGTAVQRSIDIRLFWLPLASLSAVLLYQGTDPAVFYMVGTGVYFWAYTQGEVICAIPWTLPKRRTEKT